MACFSFFLSHILLFLSVLLNCLISLLFKCALLCRRVATLKGNAFDRATALSFKVEKSVSARRLQNTLPSQWLPSLPPLPAPPPPSRYRRYVQIKENTILSAWELTQGISFPFDIRLVGTPFPLPPLRSLTIEEARRNIHGQRVNENR